MKNDPAVLAAQDYRGFIEDLKTRVTAARVSAARHVNRDMILLYWDIGRAIDDKQHMLGWGESVIDRISDDLRAAFPAATGFSPRNLRDMKRLLSTRPAGSRSSRMPTMNPRPVRRFMVCRLTWKPIAAVGIAAWTPGPRTQNA